MDQKYTIELFDSKRHNPNQFDCGVIELNNYLKERATQDRRKYVAVVYVIREDSSRNILGYYTLSSYTVEHSHLAPDITKKLPKYNVLPGVLIGRLAVTKEYQKQKLGRHLLLDALSRSLQLSQQLGLFAVIVDAKDEQAQKFYEKYGFRLFIHHKLKLYLPMGTIKTLFD